MIKILVCGGRDFCDWNYLDQTLTVITQSLQPHTDNIQIIHGNANGADWLAKAWAISKNISQKPYPANWKQNGKKAGPIRNQEMIDDNIDLTLVVAFKGGTGTKDMVQRAKKHGIEVIECY